MPRRINFATGNAARAARVAAAGSATVGASKTWRRRKKGGKGMVKDERASIYQP
jgi:hypothetical protein